MKTSRRLRNVPLAAALAAALAIALAAADPSGARAGGLAPANVVVDTAGQIGPFWGNDDGALLYARGSGTGHELIRRGLGEFSETLYAAGDSAGDTQVWSAFHGGAMNDRGDAAFIASTTLDDDSGTPEDERLLPARRGAWAHRGNTLFAIGRFGGSSPVPIVTGGSVPWGTFSDAVPMGRPDGGPLSVVFSAQLGAPDGRQGLFRWDETTGLVSVVALTGDPAPSGGAFTTFGRLRANESGDLAFYALTRVGSTGPVAGGVFRIDRDGLRARLAKFGDEGDAAPGGGTLSLLQDFDLDGAGGVVFASSVAGGPAASALFRLPPGAAGERVVRQGEATPLGGEFGTFTQAQVRCDESGSLVFSAPFADGSGAGFFAVAAGSAEVGPLGTAVEPITLASLGDGRCAFQVEGETRTIVPPDPSVEGPSDFRVALVDLRNSVALRKDAIRLDARFRTAPWPSAGGRAPAFSSQAQRFSATAALAPSSIDRIVEVVVQVSQGPGNLFVFGVGGTESAPKGTMTANGAAASSVSLALSKERDAAVWKFSAGIGRGSCAVNLSAGTLTLTVGSASAFPSFEAANFLVDVTMRTDADVAASRTGAAAYFHRSVRLDADQPSFGTGRRVTSRGERVPGGGLFLDALRVDRKLRVTKGAAAPQVTSDKVQVRATVRLNPGASPPTTPGLAVRLDLGAFSTGDLALSRVGRTGSRYAGRGNASGVAWTATYDAVSGAFATTLNGVPPIAELVDADFSGGTGPNDARRTVGGMTLPVAVRIERAYESSSDVAITRLPGGKTFTR